MFLEPFGNGYERPDEHAGIPAVLSAIEIFQRLVEVRFFDELLGAEESGLVSFDALRRRQWFAYADVAVACVRAGRLDANGDDGLAAAGQIEGIGKHLLELFFLGND